METGERTMDLQGGSSLHVTLTHTRSTRKVIKIESIKDPQKKTR